MQICAYTWIYRWTKQTVENQDWATGPPGLRASGPPGRQAVAGRGPRAAGPSGRRAAGPWRAVGRGPLGRGPAFSKTRWGSSIQKVGFINGVDNVNWPPYRDSKS